MTAIGTVDKQGIGRHWSSVSRKTRGRKRIKGKGEVKSVGTLNVGMMTGGGRELADMMQSRKVDVLCVQESV